MLLLKWFLLGQGEYLESTVSRTIYELLRQGHNLISTEIFLLRVISVWETYFLLECWNLRLPAHCLELCWRCSRWFFLPMVFGETDTLTEWSIYLFVCPLPGHSLWWDPITFTEFFSYFYTVTHPGGVKDGGFSRYTLQGSGGDVCDSTACARLTVFCAWHN